MAIYIQKTGMCKNCPCCDYELEDGKTNGLAIKCKHNDACERMTNIMNKQMEYIFNKGVVHVPTKSVNDIQMELSNNILRKTIYQAFDPEFKFIDIPKEEEK